MVKYRNIFLLAVISLCQLWCPLAIHAQSWSWKPLGSGISGVYNGMGPALEYNGKLYVGGTFSAAGGHPALNIAAWGDTTWSALGAGIGTSTMNGIVNAMAVYHNQLIVAGTFDTAGGNRAVNIAAWNDTTWTALGSGVGDTSGDTYIFALAVYNDNLYAAGDFTTAGDSATLNIAEWNDSVWSPVGKGLTSSGGGGYVKALTVYNGKLYAGGSFTYTDTTAVFNIAVWNDTAWSALAGGGVGDSSGQTVVRALTEYNGKLYAAGTFSSAGGQPAFNIASWDSASWSNLTGGGIGDTLGTTAVATLAVDSGILYAAGSFDSAGNQAAINVARWNDTSWAAMGEGLGSFGEVYLVTSLTVYNHNLYAAGLFNNSDTTVVNYVAEWRYTSPPPPPPPPPSAIREVPGIISACIAPNPNTGIFSIALNNISSISIMDIYNTSGEKIYHGHLNPGKTWLDLSFAPKGLYFYTVNDGEGIKASGKFIAQ